MNKLFEDAIAKARKLPDSEQDLAAEAILSIVHKDEPRRKLTPDQIEDIKRIQRDIRAGRMQFATDEQLASLWKKCGL